MSLGSITFSTVLWATGDVITETKMDSMQANTQAYDSHAAQGILLNNDVGYYQKDSGGTNRQLMNLNASDVLTLGEANISEIRLLSKLNLPNGTLVNGKIAVSVASNDLILALKTFAGADPSATDPVYATINNTTYKITAALSVTAADGTNYAHLGDAGLATLKNELYAFLGVSAGSVCIGWSRYDIGRLYSDFSGTATEWRYLACNVTPSSTDPFVKVGVFDAILSAGAGYTWTLPGTPKLVTAANPVAEFTPYTPQGSGSGSLTFTGLTIARADYRIVDGMCYVRFNITGTIGGTIGASSPRISAPMNPVDDPSTHISTGYSGQKQYVGGLQPAAGTPPVLTFFTYDASAFTSGSKQFAGYIGFKV